VDSVDRVFLAILIGVFLAVVCGAAGVIYLRL
jgi:hypothetical protein